MEKLLLLVLVGFWCGKSSLTMTTLQRLYDTMLNFVENLLENERDPRSGPMNDQDHSLSLSDPDRSLVPSHFLTNFLQNLASCHTALKLTCLGEFVRFYK
jgi:hypothetical protein